MGAIPRYTLMAGVAVLLAALTACQSQPGTMADSPGPGTGNHGLWHQPADVAG